MTLDYGNDGIFLIMGNAGFISSTVFRFIKRTLINKNPGFFIRFLY